nr:GNAT family N-acetyltransferase [Clostridium sp. ATCC 25772]
MDYVKNFPNDNNVFSVYSDKNELVGNCAIYLSDKVTFSVQLRPSLTSKGLGKEFLTSILNCIKERYNLKTIGLSVLKFNERAIRLYKSLDFKVTNEFIGKTVKGEMEFLAMEKEL